MTSRVLVALAFLGTLPFPGGRVAAAQQGIRLNYANADVRDVIRSLGAVLGVNVLVGEDVPARRVTYTTPAVVPPAQLGAVLEAILESQGLMLVARGPVAEVVPAARAPATGTLHFGKELPDPPPLGLITQIVPLQFIRAEEGVALLKQVASPLARLDVVPRSNAVLVTDRGVNVARYLALFRQVDVASHGEAGLRTFVYRLKHANATELASTLAQIYGLAPPATPTRARVQALEDRGLARTLDAFRRRELEALDQRRETPIPAQLLAPATAGDTAGSARAGLVGQTTIVPDPATNSLVLRTAPPNYPVLQETIEALDVRPPQVLLEVLIAEVTLDRATEFGVDWSVLARDVSGADVTGRFGPQQFSDSALGGVRDFLLRVVRLGTDVDARGVLRALSSATNVRVLSTPHVLALNNEEARILVGSEVPFSQSTRTGLDVVVDRIVQFRNVGTQLTVIPTVNQDGYVTFRVLQEVSALTTQTVEAALNAPIITIREAETSAIVKNGQTVVIGGLIGETEEGVESGVPILKDVPILGLLFKSRSTRRARTELAIFLTPHVVFTDEDVQRILDRERERLKAVPDTLGGARRP